MALVRAPPLPGPRREGATAEVPRPSPQRLPIYGPALLWTLLAGGLVTAVHVPWDAAHLVHAAYMFLLGWQLRRERGGGARRA